MMNGIQFQRVQTPNVLSSKLRSVIRDNVLQFYVQGNGIDAQEEGITALYERLSQEDKLDGESNSIANQYFIDFPDDKLTQNKEEINGKPHDRPCFYAFKDEGTDLYWMIPFSSQVKKFKVYYNSKIARYGKCDTIAFGEVLGFKKAFLIQNMCPITEKYIKNEYIDARASIPVKIDGRFEAELICKAKRVLALQRKGINLIFPDVLKIERELLGN